MGWFKRNYVGTLRWEAIRNEGDSGRPQGTYRAKVPGGWLVETQNIAGSCGGLTFLPDPEHRWTLSDPP
jgi:hypothetical protein